MNDMRFERLVLEAEGNTFSLRFHPRLTVISGVGRLEREGLITELVGSLGSSRPGVHAEIAADNGNRFAIFRPPGAPARVIDVEAAADVSHRFADEFGDIDLLALGGLDERSAKRRMRLTHQDLTTSTHHDQIIRDLAAIEPERLWGLADRVEQTRRDLEVVAGSTGSAPEDAAIVARIEDRHAEFEAAQEKSERVRHISFVFGAVAALTAVPSVLFVGRSAAMVFIIVAAIVTGWSFMQHRRMEQAGEAADQALAEAGAESYLGFHLQRVNGLLESQASRHKVLKASADHEAAMDAWFDAAGGIVVEWAYEHRGEIEDAARRLQGVDALSAGPLPVGTESDELANHAHALMQALEQVQGIGPAGQSLPLILDDALSEVDPDLKAPLLEMLVRASGDQQIVFLTEDPDVADWARVEAMTGDLSILEPTPDTPDDGLDLADSDTIHVV